MANILSEKFAHRLRAYVTDQENDLIGESAAEIEKTSSWKVSKPPHKHRYLYQHPSAPDELRTSQEDSPLTELLDVFLPSRQFRHWLQVATKCTVTGHDIVARRFRHGKDYTLATGHEGDARLEVNLGFTPTSGWGEEDGADDPEEDGKASEPNGKGKGKAKAKEEERKDDDVGGHEIYMAGDDDAGGDAAVYNSSGDDDNILFFQGAAWNVMTIILRDSGTLKFIKYVSRQAPGDRWDISSTFEIEEQNDDLDDEHEQDGNGEAADESEEEFEGFSDSNDSDSD